MVIYVHLWTRSKSFSVLDSYSEDCRWDFPWLKGWCGTLEKRQDVELKSLLKYFFSKMVLYIFLFQFTFKNMYLVLHLWLRDCLTLTSILENARHNLHGHWIFWFGNCFTLTSILKSARYNWIGHWIFSIFFYCSCCFKSFCTTFSLN